MLPLKTQGSLVTHAAYLVTNWDQTCFTLLRTEEGKYFVTSQVFSPVTSDDLRIIASVFLSGRDIPVVSLGLLTANGEFISEDLNEPFANEGQNVLKALACR